MYFCPLQFYRQHYSLAIFSNNSTTSSFSSWNLIDKKEELSLLKALYNDNMYCKRGLHLNNVDIKMPANYILIENITLLTCESTNSYTIFWKNDYDVYKQFNEKNT